MWLEVQTPCRTGRTEAVSGLPGICHGRFVMLTASLSLLHAPELPVMTAAAAGSPALSKTCSRCLKENASTKSVTEKTESIQL